MWNALKKCSLKSDPLCFSVINIFKIVWMIARNRTVSMNLENAIANWQTSTKLFQTDF